VVGGREYDEVSARWVKLAGLGILSIGWLVYIE
jgi:hypothetical protein